ncbi:MAG TPA: PLP-dependent aminotransferase family protein [Acidothermaceae bacterium]
MARSKEAPVDGSKTADFLHLSIADVRRGDRCDSLTEQLRQAIRDGRLTTGVRLPSSRVLADELDVSRGVVTEAYRRLSEGGQLTSHGRGGTVVVAAPLPDKAMPDDAAAATGLAPDAIFQRPFGNLTFEQLRAAPARIDLSPGVPDLAAFPRNAWLRAERRVLDSLEPADFGYAPAAGATEFRLAVSRWLARNRGVRVEPEQVIAVAGVAQALALLAKVLRADGSHLVAVEDPSSLGVREHLRANGIGTTPVAIDDKGLRVDELRRSSARVVHLTPAHQFPMGVVLDGDRRRDLAQWAVDNGGLIIEDDYDAEHRYDRPPVPALRSMLPEHVCYASSVSKLLAPALRIGWLVVPARMHEAVVAAKRDNDLGNAGLPQLTLAALMESGDLERHLRLLRQRHRRRRDAMVEALREHVPSARAHGAAAGLHLTVTFGEPVDDIWLAQRALSRGVKTQPLSMHRLVAGDPGLVLGYAARSPSEIAEGIAIIAQELNRTGDGQTMRNLTGAPVSRAGTPPGAPTSARSASAPPRDR